MGYSLKVFFALLARYFLLIKQKKLSNEVVLFSHTLCSFQGAQREDLFLVLDDCFDPG